MTEVERLARFVTARSWSDLSEGARVELKIRVLDSLGCALGALGAAPVEAVRLWGEEFGGRPLCTLIGGGASAPDRAAFHNGAAICYLDFNDSYFAPGETCHPSDNLAPVLAAVEALEAEGTRDVGQAIELAKRHFGAGAPMVMIESEGITERVREWRTDVVARIVSELGLEHVMFEAAEPDVFTWYVRNYGIDVNLFVDHSQIVQLECLRSGIWGTDDTWGRLLTYRGIPEEEGLQP